MNWKLHIYYAFLLALALSPPAYIAALEWGRRACADPNAWQQKSWGRAVAECKMLGGKAYGNSYDGTVECTKTTELKP